MRPSANLLEFIGLTFSEIMGNLATGFKNMVGLITSDYNFRMAIVLHKEGKWKKAEEMYRQVLDVRRRVLGEDHPITLGSKNNLAAILHSQGKWQEAEEMHRQVLDVRRRVLGEEHPDTFSSKNNLAYVLQSQGKWQEAEEMRGQVLDVRKRVLGEEHPDTLSSMEGLAGTVAERDREDWQFRYSQGVDSHYGRLVDAINKLRTSIAAQTVRADDEHPHLLRRRVDLAALLVQMNQESELKEADDLLRQAIPALQKRYGFSHALTARATRHLVFLLEEQGKDAEEWRQHLADIEENDVAISQETLEDCEDPEVAELVREFVAKQRLQIFVVDPSSASASTPATAPTSSIAPSQGLQVVSEAASKSDRASDVRSSDSSAWWEAALQQKLRERSKRVEGES